MANIKLTVDSIRFDGLGEYGHMAFFVNETTKSSATIKVCAPRHTCVHALTDAVPAEDCSAACRCV